MRAEGRVVIGVTHTCPIRTGAGGLINADWCIDLFGERLKNLPRELPEQRITRQTELLLWKQKSLSIYYAPFERVNPLARIFLVGLTPGRRQMWEGCTAASRALRDGQSIPEVLEAATRTASFAGSMRTNLVSMLDRIGVARWFGIETCAEFWNGGEVSIYEDSTSALLHPVFVDGHNYSGQTPRIEDVPILSAYVDQVLASYTELVPQALIVPLGKAVNDSFVRLIASGRVSQERVLVGFPHPSGSNGWRVRQFQRERARMAREVKAWSAEHVVPLRETPKSKPVALEDSASRDTRHMAPARQ